jgi:hypothetical protein
MALKFFIGLHHPSTAWPFKHAMLSAVALRTRKSNFRVNDWILDSGAFSQITGNGRFLISTDEYLDLITRCSASGNLLAAVCQDWMCEEFVLEITGLTKEEHQERTVRSYKQLRRQSPLDIMPVLQGFTPQDYINHLEMYGDALHQDAWCGVGSVCKRNGNPDAIEDVFLAIKSVRPDLRLHGFGIKKTALKRATVRDLLYSCDSMAWSYAGRKDTDQNDPRGALQYCAQVEEIIKAPTFVQTQLSAWWS